MLKLCQWKYNLIVLENWVCKWDMFQLIKNDSTWVDTPKGSFCLQTNATVVYAFS